MCLMHNATYRVHNNNRVNSTVCTHSYSNLVWMFPFALCHDHGFKLIRFHLTRTFAHAARIVGQSLLPLLYDGIVLKEKLNTRIPTANCDESSDFYLPRQKSRFICVELFQIIVSANGNLLLLKALISLFLHFSSTFQHQQPKYPRWNTCYIDRMRLDVQ